uniref:Uncharacterized protein n=1 Tax=Setaria viridis TaxID=4556 RepID=A0A4U6TI60_SETVI|nr:hypothetical protein SEVIR_8G220500v2 [Setaria viridis]
MDNLSSPLVIPTRTKRLAYKSQLLPRRARATMTESFELLLHGEQASLGRCCPIIFPYFRGDFTHPNCCKVPAAQEAAAAATAVEVAVTAIAAAAATRTLVASAATEAALLVMAGVSSCTVATSSDPRPRRGRHLQPRLCPPPMRLGGPWQCKRPSSC